MDNLVVIENPGKVYPANTSFAAAVGVLGRGWKKEALPTKGDLGRIVGRGKHRLCKEFFAIRLLELQSPGLGEAPANEGDIILIDAHGVKALSTSSQKDITTASDNSQKTNCETTKLKREVEECRAELEVVRAEMEALRQQQHLAEQQRAAAVEVELRQRAWAIASPSPWPSYYVEFRLDRLSPKDPVCALFTDLFSDSCVEHRKDLHSKQFCPPPKLIVRHIEIVVNPRLLHQYHVKAEEIEGLRRGGCGNIPPFSHLKIPSRRGSAALWPDLNEHFLFHGATKDAVKEICRGGFDPRRGGEGVGKMFGVATYLAMNASKSDIYTEHPAQRLPKQAERQIIVARAILGESHRALQSMQSASRPPDGIDGRPLDSVWADTRTNGGAVDHYEVMTYDKGQAYPEAVVTYVHSASCAKRPQA